MDDVPVDPNAELPPDELSREQLLYQIKELLKLDPELKIITASILPSSVSAMSVEDLINVLDQLDSQITTKRVNKNILPILETLCDSVESLLGLEGLKKEVLEDELCTSGLKELVAPMVDLVDNRLIGISLFFKHVNSLYWKEKPVQPNGV